MLINNFINLRDKMNTSFELNRLFKLLNNNLKVFQYNQSYYFKYSDILLKN